MSIPLSQVHVAGRREFFTELARGVLFGLLVVGAVTVWFAPTGKKP